MQIWWLEVCIVCTAQRFAQISELSLNRHSFRQKAWQLWQCNVVNLLSILQHTTRLIDATLGCWQTWVHGAVGFCGDRWDLVKPLNSVVQLMTTYRFFPYTSSQLAMYLSNFLIFFLFLIKTRTVIQYKAHIAFFNPHLLPTGWVCKTLNFKAVLL